MNTNSIFTVKNTLNGKSKSEMTFEDVKRMHFTIMQRHKFKKSSLLDLVVVDQNTNESFNMINMEF